MDPTGERPMQRTPPGSPAVAPTPAAPPQRAAAKEEPAGSSGPRRNQGSAGPPESPIPEGRRGGFASASADEANLEPQAPAARGFPQAAGAVLTLFPRLWAWFQTFAAWVWVRTRRARHPDVALAAVKLAGPLLVLAAGVVLALVLFPQGLELVTFSLGYFFVPFLGAFGAPTAALAQGVPWWALVSFVAFAALCGSAWLAFNFDWVLRIPWFGPWLARTEAGTAKRLERHKWLGRFEFWGVALFVALPFGGASGPVGIALGRLLGMNAFFTFLSVWVGSVIQVVGLVAAAKGVLDAFV